MVGSGVWSQEVSNNSPSLTPGGLPWHWWERFSFRLIQTSGQWGEMNKLCINCPKAKFHRTVGHLKLEGTNTDHWLQFLASHRTTQNSDHMAEIFVQMLPEHHKVNIYSPYNKMRIFSAAGGGRVWEVLCVWKGHSRMPLDLTRMVRAKKHHAWGQICVAQGLGCPRAHLQCKCPSWRYFCGCGRRTDPALRWGIIAVNLGCHGE